VAPGGVDRPGRPVRGGRTHSVSCGAGRVLLVGVALTSLAWLAMLAFDQVARANLFSALHWSQAAAAVTVQAANAMPTPARASSIHGVDSTLGFLICDLDHSKHAI
jgi:hypothetical protein